MITEIKTLLEEAGVQPTPIRLALAEFLFDGEHKHVTAQEALAALNKRRRLPSLASLYNTLNEFCRAGLLQKVTLDGGPAWFDTRTERHYHLYHEDEGRLEDVAVDALKISGWPRLPPGMKIGSVDLIIRVSRK